MTIPKMNKSTIVTCLSIETSVWSMSRMQVIPSVSMRISSSVGVGRRIVGRWWGWGCSSSISSPEGRRKNFSVLNFVNFLVRSWLSGSAWLLCALSHSGGDGVTGWHGLNTMFTMEISSGDDNVSAVVVVTEVSIWGRIGSSEPDPLETISSVRERVGDSQSALVTLGVSSASSTAVNQSSNETLNMESALVECSLVSEIVFVNVDD